MSETSFRRDATLLASSPAIDRYAALIARWKELRAGSTERFSVAELNLMDELTSVWMELSPEDEDRARAMVASVPVPHSAAR